MNDQQNIEKYHNKSDNIPLTWFCILPVDIRNIIHKYLISFQFYDHVLLELKSEIKIFQKYIEKSQQMIINNTIPIYNTINYQIINNHHHITPSCISLLVKHNLIYSRSNNIPFIDIYNHIHKLYKTNKEHLICFSPIFILIFNDIDQDIFTYKNKITHIKIFYKDNLCYLNNMYHDMCTSSYVISHSNTIGSSNNYVNRWEDNKKSFQKYLSENVDINTQKLRLLNYLDFIIYNCGHFKSILRKCYRYIAYIQEIEY